jgi:hypothetical protein
MKTHAKSIKPSHVLAANARLVMENFAVVKYKLRRIPHPMHYHTACSMLRMHADTPDAAVKAIPQCHVVSLMQD